MAFCAQQTIQKVKDALGRRKLDYIFMTHYDHIGALPFFRKEWSELYLAGSKAAAEVFLKETPCRNFREFAVLSKIGCRHEKLYSGLCEK